MLKNMKVGTKLIAVLVAPVLVLVILASIGVSQRLDTASSAKRASTASRTRRGFQRRSAMVLAIVTIPQVIRGPGGPIGVASSMMPNPMRSPAATFHARHRPRCVGSVAVL